MPKLDSTDLLNRTKRVLSTDKSGCVPLRLNEVLKSDLYDLLSNYMELDRLEMNTEFDSEGNCYVNMVAKAYRIKTSITLPR